MPLRAPTSGPAEPVLRWLRPVERRLWQVQCP
jgi:hypothetical protein